MESMDLVQDAFISALRSLRNFTYKDEGDFLRWISRIAENRIRDNVRKLRANKRNIRGEKSLNNKSTAQDRFSRIDGPVDTATPSRIMSERETFDKLVKATDKLKPEYREVIILTKIEGLSYKEAANKLEKSPDATRMLLSRALAALTTCFQRT
jgi:RNA polymerase sigma-70 factor (ECF subfamily)